MFLGKVVGTVWATRKDEELVGLKLQIVKHIGLDYALKETFVVAVDTVQAGTGDVVLVCSGSSARRASAPAGNRTGTSRTCPARRQA